MWGPLLLAVAMSTVATSSGATEIRVMISGGFSAAYDELVPEFEQLSGHKVLTVRGASFGDAANSIPVRMARGEPADIVILAGKALDDLTLQGRVVRNSRVDLAQSSIGMVVRKGSVKPDISTVDALKRTLLQARSIAYSASASGIYLSTELFPRLGIHDAIGPKCQRIQGERVGTVVARGDAEIGFQQVSELLPISGVDFVGELPSEAQKITIFSAGLVVGAAQPEAARLLIEYLAAPQALDAVKRSGMEPMASSLKNGFEKHELSSGVQTVEVSTLAGRVAGFDGKVKTFKGIPFAAPPIGPLRWQPPQPLQPWSGVRPAKEFGADPIQSRLGRKQSEDCLYLNVWTPDAHPREPLPVMVWIYGGGFKGGSGAYDAASFAEKGVVIVTINYRVGLFGFLAHRLLTEESPQGSSGNYGLLDQVAALQWVADNIAAFGGDPKRVTVFGNSAGASSISLLLTSPLTRGLFHRAILQSPGSMRPLSSLAEAESAGELIGNDLAAMRALPKEKILALGTSLSPAVRSLTKPRPVGPISDGWVIPFADERAAFDAGGVNKVDLIIGSNTDEGIGFVHDWPITTLEQYREFLVQNFDAAAEEVFGYYPIRRDREIRATLSALFSDTQFVYGVRGMARGMSALGANVFRYYFSRQRNDGEATPSHGDEVAYVFGQLGREKDMAGFNQRDQELSQVMQDAWIRFAATGNPNGGSLPSWPRYESVTDPYLEFGNQILVGAERRNEKLDFLDRLSSAQR